MDMEEYIHKHSRILRDKDKEIGRKVKDVMSMESLIESMHEEFSVDMREKVEEVKKEITMVREELERCEEVGSKLTPRNMFESTENLIKNSSVSKSISTERFIEWLYES